MSDRSDLSDKSDQILHKVRKACQIVIQSQNQNTEL